MPASLLVLLLLLGTSASQEADACPEPIAAVMKQIGRAPEWLETLVIDADGDGALDVFVENGSSGNAGKPWKLYRSTEEGEYEAVGTVFFHPLGFKLEDSRLETYWRLNAGSGNFITYRVSSVSIDEVESTELLTTADAEYETRWRSIAAWRPNLKDRYFGAKWQGPTDGEGRFVCRGFW